eukprot:scaffold15108_cov180-Amphora_coffeaeformis.AAC.55
MNSSLGFERNNPSRQCCRFPSVPEMAQEYWYGTLVLINDCTIFEQQQQQQQPRWSVVFWCVAVRAAKI